MFFIACLTIFNWLTIGSTESNKKSLVYSNYFANLFIKSNDLFRKTFCESGRVRYGK